MISRPSIRVFGLLFLVGAHVTGCGGEGGGDGGDGLTGPNTADTTPPSVSSVQPTNQASGVGIGSAISVTFSEEIDPSSISSANFSVNNGVTGSVGCSGRTAAFVPGNNLEYSTSYTATVSSGVRDMAGNVMSGSYSWSFTTEASPIPTASFPLVAGTRWLYDLDWSLSAWDPYNGFYTEYYSGKRVLFAESQATYQGRSAWRLFQFDLEENPGVASGLTVRDIIVSQGSDGLHKWTGSRWKRVLSTQVPTFDDNTFLMAGGPGHGEGTVLSLAQVSVPAGTFNTVKAFHEFRQTGPYAPEDIFEKRWEYYADGVGLVKASWDYDFDDNDPQGSDVHKIGTVALEYFDAGPIPDVFIEAEPNNAGTPTASQPLSTYSILIGSTAISDPGTVVNDPNVHENVLGQKLIQDWYRLEVPTSGPLRFDMPYLGYTNNDSNDLDLYLFREESNGSLTYQAKAVLPERQAEFIVASYVPAGTYYVAVQAWATPTGSVDYWIGIR